MTGSRIALLALLLCCLGLVAGAVGGQSGAADTTARVELGGPATATPGETVTIRVNVTTTRPLYAAQFGLAFDETALTPTAVNRGSFLSGDARSVLIANDTRPGTASYGETRVGTDTGVNGNGTLATVSVEVAEAAAGESVALELRDVKLVTPETEAVTTSTGNLTIEVNGSSGGSDSGSDDGDGGSGGGGGGGQLGGASQGEVSIANLSLLNTTVTTDGTAVTRVDLTNLDPASGRITLTLTANGSAVAERTLSVGAATDRTVFLRHRFSRPGTYALRVNDDRAGVVRVTAATTPTAEPTDAGTPTPTPTPTDPSSAGSDAGSDANTTSPPSGSQSPTAGDGAGFGVGSVVVALAVLLIRHGRD
ncbi:cohesin domain-containing protein [Salinirubellus sp. GCM10025818]|uniref:cohesin domain-containing protein n=1 Tax=Salinirubellus TaxID=2162630 RepID=UPI0030CEF19B